MQAVRAFPPAILGYNTKLKNEFNPTRAKELLKQVGFASGLSIDLWALPVARPTNPNGQLMAQLIQQDWAKIGVKAKRERPWITMAHSTVYNPMLSDVKGFIMAPNGGMDFEGVSR
jgi:ABC-type transport system substrate-binding protein